MVIGGRYAVTGALLALALAGCGGNGSGAVEATPGQTTGPGVPAQPTSNPAGNGSGDSGSDGVSEPETVIDPNGDEQAPDDDHTVAIGDTFQVPDLENMDVQAAQDLLQGRNSYELTQKDATGKGRKVLKDTDWKVCSQIPAAGKYVPVDSTVKILAVKAGETCP